MPGDFHFLAPEWFLLMIPASLLLWRIWHQGKRKSQWEQVIEPQLINHLLVNQQGQSSGWPRWLLLISLLLAITALANPVWEKKPRQVYQTPGALVIVMDLSASMNASDLPPSRLVQTRLKIQDMLERQNEGLTGLVVFAGDAFSVTPLTRDNQTILSQLRVLQPDIMPVQGSRADLGLEMAGELLQQAGIERGDVLLFADGFDSSRSLIQAKQLRSNGHRLSVIGTATEQGAPVSDGRGDVIRDRNNVPVLSRLDSNAMQSLAEQGGGIFQPISTDNRDIEQFLSLTPLNRSRTENPSDIRQIAWQENGPYLAVLLLPLAALAFRRGWLMVLLIGICLPLPRPASALSWQDLWQTPEQQASTALQAEQYEQAHQLSEQPAIKGSALYRQQQYAEALSQFEQLENADAHYNRGNSLAHLQRYEEAIAAYDKALEMHPGMSDAEENRRLIQQLLQQKQEQEQQQKKSSQDPSQNSQSNDSDQSNNDSSESSSESSQQDTRQQNQSDANASEQQGSGNEQDQPDAQTNAAKQNPSDTTPGSPPEEKSPAAGENPPESGQSNPATAQNDTDKAPSESDMATEQWLRRIPDDPGDLLKRKFLYQYQQRNRQPVSGDSW